MPLALILLAVVIGVVIKQGCVILFEVVFLAMGCVWVGLWVGLSVDIAHYVRLIGYACK